MSVTFNINKFKLLNSLRFPKQQKYKNYISYICNDREWFIFCDRHIFNCYENKPYIKFGLLYVDTEDIIEYYTVYPLSKKI